MNQYKGVTTQSHLNKESEPGGKVVPPTTAPAKPVGSAEANPEPEVVKDTSEAVPKNATETKNTTENTTKKALLAPVAVKITKVENATNNATTSSEKPKEPVSSVPALKNYQGVTTQSKWEK